MYPVDRSEIDAESSKWQKMAKRNKKATGPTLGGILDTAGAAGQDVMLKIFHVRVAHCMRRSF